MPVGQTVAVIGEEGEEVSIADAGAPRERGEAAPRRRPASPTASEGRDGRCRGRARRAGERRAAPRRDERRPHQGERRSRAGSRASAASSSRRVRGTGPDGRIVAEDVERAAGRARRGARGRLPAPVVSGEVESVPLTNIRRTIARRLDRGLDGAGLRADRLGRHDARERARRARARARSRTCASPSPTCWSKVCAQALARHPDVNVQFTDEALLRFPTANVGLAVAAPTRASSCP